MSGDDPTNKAERLALAGAVAAPLRQQSEKAARRPVKVVKREDFEAGKLDKVVGHTTLIEVQKTALKRHEIEIEVEEGKRPKEIICKDCGKPGRVGKTGKIPERCRKCAMSRERDQSKKGQPRYRAANQEKLRDMRRKYRATNPERDRDVRRKYVASNRERVRKNQRKYVEANREELNKRRRIARAKKKANLENR